MDIARSTLKLYAAQLGSSLFVMAGLVFFSRQLGAATVGAFFLFQALLEMLMIPADFGLRGAVEKRISGGERSANVFGTAVLLKTGSLVVVIAGIVALQAQINAYVGADLALYLAVAVVLREFSWLTMRVLKGELRVEETAVLKFTQKATWVVVGAVLVVLGYGVRGMVYGLLTGFFVVLVWGAAKVSTPLGRPSRRHAWSLFDYAKYNVVTSVQGYITNWLDVVVIGFFLTQSHVGAYEVSWRIITFVVLFSKVLAQTIFPQISEWHAEDAPGRIEALITAVLTPSVFFLIPSLVGVSLLSREILGLIFGPEFEIAWLAFVVLMAYNVVRGAGVIFGRTLNAIDQPRLAAVTGVVATALNLVLNVALVYEFGLVGAAVATAVSAVVGTFLDVSFLSRFIEITIPVREIGWCVLSALVMGIVVMAARSLVTVDTVPKLILVVALGASVYFAVALTMRPIRTKVFRYLPSVHPALDTR